MREGGLLPDAVRSLALRLGVREDTALSSVTLTQRGAMRSGPASRWMRFRATQMIDLCRPQFEWRAVTGPFGLIRVIDAFHDDQPKLEVRLFPRLRIASVSGGAAAAKGEIMRYLAELAWAPDAILHNRLLVWTVIDDRTMRVSAGQDRTRGEVELRLNDAGRIDGVFAPDRPRKEGSGFVERPWHGRFGDYRLHESRWLPFAGEVEWAVDGQEFVAWRGEMLSWRPS